MDQTTILYILLGIVTFDFVLERVLHLLNRRRAKDPIPKELEGIYDEQGYANSQAYLSDISRFGTLTASLNFVLVFLALSLGWFGWLDSIVRDYAAISLITPIYFFGVLFLVSDIFGSPFSMYRQFVIEAKYGFNKMTMKTFWLDKLKGILLGMIIGGLLLAVFMVLIEFMGSNFWIYFWAIMIAFTLFANMFYTSLILPLFNKLTPLEDGDLKASIQAYCEKVNFPLKNIFILDGSKRSSKGNAFFSGLGKRKKVVLYDTLVEKHSTEELTAVFAHEVGHFKKKHILVSTIFSILMMGLMLYLLSLLIFNSQVSWAMGGVSTAVHLNLLAFGILYSPISHILGLLGNVLSRKNEYEADAYAKETYVGEPLVTALKKMSSDHLSNLTPHPAYVFVHYSHPTLLQRVKALLN
jgi:STE24 endopeptidase